MDYTLPLALVVGFIAGFLASQRRSRRKQAPSALLPDDEFDVRGTVLGPVPGGMHAGPEVDELFDQMESEHPPNYRLNEHVEGVVLIRCPDAVVRQAPLSEAHAAQWLKDNGTKSCCEVFGGVMVSDEPPAPPHAVLTACPGGKHRIVRTLADFTDGDKLFAELDAAERKAFGSSNQP